MRKCEHCTTKRSTLTIKEKERKNEYKEVDLSGNLTLSRMLKDRLRTFYSFKGT